MEDLEKKAKEAIELLDSNKDYLYFAHPVNTFNTQKEKDLIETLENIFPDYEIYNPNQKDNKENYKLWKEKTGSGMKYYYGVILPEMDAGVYLAFEDGMIGTGAFSEVEFLIKNNKPIWEINWNCDLEKVNSLDYLRKLSVEETKARVYGKKM